MFPRELPAFVRENPLRAAECKVYDRLRHLPADYTVFYSRPWLGLTSDGREIDGEADFVVAHPRYGVLALEVKGGSILHDARTGEWTSVDRMRIPHPIKNPVGQARQSKHQLLRKLRECGVWRPRYVHAAHGVVFPDVAAPPGDLGADMPRFLFACRDEMPYLPDWVSGRMAVPSSDGDGVAAYEPLGTDGVAALEHLIARSFELHAPLAAALASDERRVVTLTEQQYEVLDGLERNRRCAVAGAAGTGKTLLALEKARRLATAGQRTLLTCYSEPLATYLRRASANVPRLEVLAFHELCRATARAAGLSPDEARKDSPGDARGDRRRGRLPPDGREATDYDDPVLPELLAKAVDLLPPNALYDAIVVDEGQDFRAAWWVALELCLRDATSGEFYVFYDDNQRVYPGTSGWPGDLMPYTLTRNVRNTKPVCAQSLPFYAGSPLKAAGPEGRPVEWIEAETDQDVLVALHRMVARLTGPDEIRVEDIAVLARGLPPAARLSGNRISGFPLTRADAPNRGELTLDTVARFKGLERRVIILVNPETMIDDPELLYVGVTRASLHLIVIGAAGAAALMQSMARGVKQQVGSRSVSAQF
jgi:hypothetical protein